MMAASDTQNTYTMTVSTRTLFLSRLRSYSASSTTSCPPAVPSRTEPPHERTLPEVQDLPDIAGVATTHCRNARRRTNPGNWDTLIDMAQFS